MKKTKIHRGFTIVELLIVIVVIGILATITIVAFNGIQQRAYSTAVKSDLSGAARQMEVARVDSSDGSYPSTLPGGVKTSQGVILQLAKTASSGAFCINAYRSAPYAVASYDSQTATVRDYLCPGAAIGSAVGGAPPSAPRGVNLASDFSTWVTSGGVTYSSSTQELTLSTSSVGSAASPLIRIDEPASARLAVESYSTTSAPSFAPDGGVHFTSAYYAADGTTAVMNTTGHTANGHANRTALSSWVPYAWTTSAGPGVVYVQFFIRSSPGNYTSDNRVRNVSVVAVD